ALVTAAVWRDKTFTHDVEKLEVPAITAPYALSDQPIEYADATPLADSIVEYAKQYMGTCYLYAGKGPEGFDCSGFVYYVFKNFGIDVPAGSKYYDTLGIFIPLAEAMKGDIIVFTGTDSTKRSPGHVGIVISDKGEPVSFIHSSSAKSHSGVKVSNLEETGYSKRFLSVRRVLK
ncbi:MAG: C40 family peptidase, partial [Bacteroidota bacterium]|nr:C40 family peptidase [Bacteroidota bacterium]